MNKRVNINEVIRMLDFRISLNQVHQQLLTPAQQAKLTFIEPIPGSGYMQWSVPGEDWTSFTQADDVTKSRVAETYEQRKKTMLSLLEGSPLKDVVFTIPSTDFIFFRPNADSFDIAIAGWAFKYPDKKPGGELDTWITKTAMQQVNIGFSWEDKPLPNISFKLVGHTRMTGADGLFHIDGLLPVGKSYAVETLTGQTYTLTVTQGQADYVYDLTQYVTVNIDVQQNDAPAPDVDCSISFNGHLLSAKTDEGGHATLQIALAGDKLGMALVPQPNCVVSCNGQSQSQTPIGPNDVLSYTFQFKDEVPPPPVPEPEVAPPPPPEPEPEFVYVHLLDYGGFPLPQLPFALTLAKQGRLSLQTDEQGTCQLPKEWFTPNEKMQFQFEVTPEYQASHDLHDPKHTKAPIRYNHRMKYQEQFNDYTLQMVHRHKPWWLLLLLLPLLLLIQCNKDITVSCMEPDTGAPIDNIPVTMTYQSHAIYRNGHFFTNDSVTRTQNTDTEGKTVFRDLPCSVYSYIFYCMSKASFTAKSECHAAVAEEHNFHYTRHVDLNMQARREDLHVQLLDLETGDPLPDGYIVYRYHELSKQMTDSAKADPAGVVTLPQMRYCEKVELLLGRCYGYADTTRADVPARLLIAPDDSMALRLRPIKKSFDFFVKNKKTKEPIPGATCVVTLTRPKPSTASETRTVTTSLDGKGKAFYADGFMLSTIAIHASKPHYKDGDLEGGPWTVEEFRNLDTLQRTIWLEPEPYVEQFVNVDSITGNPIKGVKNDITVTDADGKQHTYTEVSNVNGVFPVSAEEDSRLDIHSTCDPYYDPKKSYYPVFKDIKDKRVRMKPVMKTLTFRTVKATSPGTLVPGCNLRISGTISGPLTASTGSTSGQGTFDVTFRRAERLTIQASKSGWNPTTNKITSQTYDELQGDQSKRDIPLKPNPVPHEYNGDQQGMGRDCYELNDAPVTFTFDWRICDYCTTLTVTDANGNVLGSYNTASGSVTLTSPTSRVCVTRKNDNGHACWYRILAR